MNTKPLLNTNQNLKPTTHLTREVNVLYEDNHLIAVVKEPGVLVQGDDSGGRSGVITLMDDVKSFLKKKYNKPGNVFLGLVHRLDRPVGGEER